MASGQGPGAESVAHYTQRHSILARRWRSKVTPYWSVDVLNQGLPGSGRVTPEGEIDEISVLFGKDQHHFLPELPNQRLSQLFWNCR